DGITEAANEQGELFAEARLEAVLRAAAGCSTAAEIVTSVAQAVRGFVGGALPSDDITMLAVRRLDQSALWARVRFRAPTPDGRSNEAMVASILAGIFPENQIDSERFRSWPRTEPRNLSTMAVPEHAQMPWDAPKVEW